MDRLYEKWNSKKNDSKHLSVLSKKLDKLPNNHQSADRIHDEVFHEIDCLKCANCCKSIPPILSNRDIKRISKRLNVTTQSFHKKYVRVDSDGDQVINASPCPFLKVDNSCGIYEFRPAACRDYPHSGENQFFKNKNHHKRNMKYCPALMEIVSRLIKEEQ